MRSVFAESVPLRPWATAWIGERTHAKSTGPHSHEWNAHFVILSLSLPRIVLYDVHFATDWILPPPHQPMDLTLHVQFSCLALIGGVDDALPFHCRDFFFFLLFTRNTRRAAPFACRTTVDPPLSRRTPQLHRGIKWFQSRRSISPTWPSCWPR